jgi:hypothetical protein
MPKIVKSLKVLHCSAVHVSDISQPKTLDGGHLRTLDVISSPMYTAAINRLEVQHTRHAIVAHHRQATRNLYDLDNMVCTHVHHRML